MWGSIVWVVCTEGRACAPCQVQALSLVHCTLLGLQILQYPMSPPDSRLGPEDRHCLSPSGGHPCCWQCGGGQH